MMPFNVPLNIPNIRQTTLGTWTKLDKEIRAASRQSTVCPKSEEYI